MTSSCQRPVSGSEMCHFSPKTLKSWHMTFQLFFWQLRRSCDEMAEPQDGNGLITPHGRTALVSPLNLH